MSDINNKTAPRRFRNTHQVCKSKWNHQRREENNPQSAIVKNRKYYQKSKSKSITSKANQLLRERQRNQRYGLNKTMNDIEEISFGISGRKDRQKFKKSVAFGETVLLEDREKQLEELARQEEQARRIGSMRKYKYYFLENLREGHPKYSPYTMFERRAVSPVPIENPVPKGPYYIPYDPDVRHKYPRSIYTDEFIDNARFSPSLRYNYGVNNPLRSAFLTPTSKNLPQIPTGVSMKYLLPKRNHTQGKVQFARDNLPSKEELKNIFGNHQEQIIQFLIDLVKKQ